jgi:hypothetical protein
MNFRIRRPSHATVVAYLALLTALGGSAYAASKLGTGDLKDGAVTSAKIKNQNVRAADVKEPIVRVVRTTGTIGAATVARVRCKANERLIGGGGGWDADGTIQFSGPGLKAAPPTPVTDYTLVGQTSIPNTLEARAICLPK